MNSNPERVVHTQMLAKKRFLWNNDPCERSVSRKSKRLLKRVSFSAAAAFVLGLTAMKLFASEYESTPVMKQVTADFDYDETLGRLQFVSSILPESAMVFLQSDGTQQMSKPSQAEIVHSWSSSEPWLEYAGAEEIAACADGEVSAVIKNRSEEYTIRLRHEGGYESLYSGLTDSQLIETDRVQAGERIGYANGYAAFELRSNGLSILPKFSAP